MFQCQKLAPQDFSRKEAETSLPNQLQTFQASRDTSDEVRSLLLELLVGRNNENNYISIYTTGSSAADLKTK